jgi:hypothetical protein
LGKNSWNCAISSFLLEFAIFELEKFISISLTSNDSWICLVSCNRFWITDLCRLIDEKIENREIKFSLLVAIIEVIKDLFSGRNNQMATFNERKRREKLGSFE